MDSRIRGIKYEEDLEDVYIETANEEEKNILQNFSDLEEYIEKINVLDIGKFVESGIVSNSNSPISEVKHVGVFVTGERIFSQNIIRRLYLIIKQEVLRRRQWISCYRETFWYLQEGMITPKIL